ncbi:sarcosine oxidase subunit gamma [uncultured Amaricoccus sp.]|uniref:sarcosine oxidase subunit gamma n=1 Tax=uncultured Amaricoccus sp. TaxID=339341 RepID=UPI002632DF7F|nr:sarcosine oxidase subunit gamma [uncultured Amaricoccus sp.]
MADLAPLGPMDGLGLPVEIGGVILAPLPSAPMVSIAPFRGREAEVAAALGTPLETGTATDIGGGRLVWAGLGLWFLIGAPAPDLAGRAAVTDQGDGWAGLRVTGAAAGDVLARLVPVELDPATFAPWRVARTLLGHVMALVIARPEGYDVMVMRSFAGTAVEEITHAARAVAARAALD